MGGNEGGLRVGDRILIVGPGQRGLGAVIAARHAGASQIVVIGRNQFKLETALELGADAVINSGTEDAVTRGLELTQGEGFDLVLAIRQFPCCDAAARSWS